jgi:hypothetical protein
LSSRKSCRDDRRRSRIKWEVYICMKEHSPRLVVDNSFTFFSMTSKSTVVLVLFPCALLRWRKITEEALGDHINHLLWWSQGEHMRLTLEGRKLWWLCLCITRSLLDGVVFSLCKETSLTEWENRECVYIEHTYSSSTRITLGEQMCSTNQMCESQGVFLSMKKAGVLWVKERRHWNNIRVPMNNVSLQVFQSFVVSGKDSLWYLQDNRWNSGWQSNKEWDEQVLDRMCVGDE